MRTRAFVDAEVLPVISGYWERAEFPWPLIKKMGALGIVGDGIEGYGCPPMSPVAAGLIHMELNRGDGSLGTIHAVQAGLAMRSIWLLGSEEQKNRWLPGMRVIEGKGSVRAVLQADITLTGFASRPGTCFPVRRASRTQAECSPRPGSPSPGARSATPSRLTKPRWPTLKARQVIADARDLLGGNGILLDHHVMRHMADIEAIYTYEGTKHIQTLIVGRDITGVGAFS